MGVKAAILAIFCQSLSQGHREGSLLINDPSLWPRSVLRTFVYDPLVEWSKPAKGRSSSDTGEVKNEKASTHVTAIEQRMKGIMKNKSKPLGLPLSVEGQCNLLIKEATDPTNLCRMYIGWAAYL